MTSGPRRRTSIRLRTWDYREPAAYFVTICTHRRAHLFGRVVDKEMVVNEYGEIVREEWFHTAEMRPNVELFEHEFVVMPNHIHGIIWILPDDTSSVGATCRSPLQPSSRPKGPPSASLGAIIAGFKSAVTRRINQRRGTPGARVWQRNYWEHIIRNQRALDAIRRYIVYNPLRWAYDRYNPDATAPDPWARAIWDMMRKDARVPPSRNNL